MRLKKGDIYLANLNPQKGNEIGKLRPILVFQTNLLNEVGHLTTIILPLSTYLIDDSYPLRFRINKRDNLEKDSDIVIDQIRAIDNKSILPKLLTKLTPKEINLVSEQLKIVLDII